MKRLKSRAGFGIAVLALTLFVSLSIGQLGAQTQSADSQPAESDRPGATKASGEIPPAALLTERGRQLAEQIVNQERFMTTHSGAS